MKGSIRAGAALRCGQRLAVHSVYRHTVNLAVQDRIFAVHPDWLVLTPLSLAVPWTEEVFASFAAAAKQAGSVEVKHGPKSGRLCLAAGGQLWPAGGWEPWDPVLRVRLLPEHRELLGKLTEQYLSGKLSERPAKGKRWLETGCCDPVTAAFRLRAGEILEGGLSDEERFLQRALSVLGLGIGLTPSGDDFLTGLMLALQSADSSAFEPLLLRLKERIRHAADGTNDISRQYLLSACRGEYSLWLHRLLHACVNPAPCGEGEKALPESEKKARAVCSALGAAEKVGHSSGRDTLTGLLTGIRLMQGLASIA